MYILNLTSEDLEYLKQIGFGAEATVYQIRDKIIKLYEEPDEKNIKKIKYLSKMQKYVKRTKFPIGIAKIDNKFMGCVQEYHQNYFEMSILDYSMFIDQILFFFKEFLESIKELTDYNLYPIDLFYSNVLVRFINRDVKIIDLDKDGLVIKQEPNARLLNKSLKLYLSTILESLYYKDVFDKSYKNYTILINKYPFDNDIANTILNDKLSYEFLFEFLNYIKLDKKNILDTQSSSFNPRKVKKI